MRIDFATLAFGYKVLAGGSTPNWATALGQGKGYKINNDAGIHNLLISMVYSAVSPAMVSTKIGKGGKVVTGSEKDSPIINATVFEKVYVNDKFIPNGKLILLVTRDTSKSHAGRLRLKYGPSNTYTKDGYVYTNEMLYKKIRKEFGMADDACWFVSEINPFEQDSVNLKTIIVNKYGPVEYSDTPALHAAWEELDPYIGELVEDDSIKTGENIILYGVPGCGKSHTIKTEYCDDEDYMERVVFHPDYTYSDFVGQILPDNMGGHISYPFVEGPFTRIMKKANYDASHNYYLIIEELNRGNAPAIFGDIFQLLDRDNGISEYGISNADIAEAVYGDSSHLVKIPKNLFIIATMNTADQNVFTLDTAFKRRWKMRSIKSDISNCDLAKEEIENLGVTWETFLDTINPLIIEYGEGNIGSEDKRLGAYFVKLNELKNRSYFSEKVLMYLWNDAFKYNHDMIFKKKYTTLEQVIDGFQENGFDVFVDDISFELLKDSLSDEM